MKTRTLAPPLLALAVLAAACARLGGPGNGGIDHPTGANDLILRVATGGGFVAPGYALGRIPQFSLFGDGKLITEGPQIQIYPGPALPSVLVQTITEDGIQRILEAAREAGLMGPDVRYDFSCVTDAPTTTFTVNTNGEKHVVSAYALGLGDGQGACPGVDTAGRSKLAAFQAELGDLASWLPRGSVGEQAPLHPSEMRVYVRPYTGSPDPSLNEPVMDWPVSQPLASFGRPDSTFPDLRCGVVGGPDLVPLLAAARRANELTPWRSGGARYSLVLRPLLPDEHTY